MSRQWLGEQMIDGRAESGEQKKGRRTVAGNDREIGVDLGGIGRPVDPGELFCEAGPVEIEIGSGKGTFLLNQARLHGEVNYLGIEWANKYYRYSVDRMRRWGVTNVRIVRADARDFIRCYLADECVQAFHVYFPDPWPKKRHHKRRFFTPTNVAHVLRCLRRGGELRTATDHAEYFEVIRQMLQDSSDIGRQFEPIEFYPADAADPGEWVGSNFERKYAKEGRTIHTLAVRKR